MIDGEVPSQVQNAARESWRAACSCLGTFPQHPAHLASGQGVGPVAESVKCYQAWRTVGDLCVNWVDNWLIWYQINHTCTILPHLPL